MVWMPSTLVHTPSHSAPCRCTTTLHHLSSRPYVQAAADAAATTRSKHVVLRGGDYFLTETLELTTQHSGLTMRAHPHEHPVVSGGKELKGLKWAKFNVTGAFDPLKDPKTQGKNIWVADVSGIDDIPGLQVNGARVTRAR